MFKKLLVFSTIFWLCNAVFAQQIQPTWQLREPTNGASTPTNIFTPSILLDSFQNVIVMCEIYEPGFATGFTTIKYDPNGHKLWERNVQTLARDFLAWGVTDGAGAVYIAGESLQDPITGTPDNQLIIKYAPNGDTLWHQYFHLDPGNQQTYVQQLMLDHDQNLMVFGSWRNPATGLAGLFVQKMSPDGTTMWTNTYIENEYGFAFENAVWTGDRWICWGRNASSTIGGTRLLCWQVDSQGNTISTHTSDLNSEIIYPLHIDNEGNIFLSKGLQHKLIKYDTTATQNWTFQIPSVMSPLSRMLATTTDNENFIYTTGRVLGSDNIWRTYTTKLEQNGNLIWQNEINDGRTILDRFSWISDTILLAIGSYYTEADSNYYECSLAFFKKDGLFNSGYSDLDGNRNLPSDAIFNGSDIYITGYSGADNLLTDINRQFLAKYPINALVKTHEPPQSSAGSISVWPNPFSGQAALRIVRDGPPEKGQLSVRDMNGRLISLRDVSMEPSDQTIELEGLENAPPGVYAVMLAVGKEVYRVKAVKIGN